jgi:hypothetical protein
MAKTAHQPWSPDVAPADFYLFGDVEHCQMGLLFEAADGLFSPSAVISMGIAQSTLDAIFSNEWRGSGDALQLMVSTLKRLKKG